MIECHDKSSSLTVVKASLAFYDGIMTMQKSAGTFHKLQGIFSDIMATASRLNTLYRLETLYGHLSTHFKIIEKVVRHFRHLWHINDVINVGFLHNFAGFCYDNKCIEEFRNAWFSTRVSVFSTMRVSTNLQSLVCS